MSCQFQTVRLLIKSCSIESRNNPRPKCILVHEIKFSSKISYSTHVILAELDKYQTSEQVMVSVAKSIHAGDIFSFAETF